MNHIYKVIWNRARACWQVVSELAKSVGRMKAVRRRRGVSGAKRPAAALALAALLACSPGGPALAADSIVVTGTQTTGTADNSTTGGTGNIYLCNAGGNIIFYNVRNNHLRPGSEVYRDFKLISFAKAEDWGDPVTYHIDAANHPGTVQMTPEMYNAILDTLRDAPQDQGQLLDYFKSLPAGNPLRLNNDWDWYNGNFSIDMNGTFIGSQPGTPAVPSYDAVSLNNGAVWRPMDHGKEITIASRVDIAADLAGIRWGDIIAIHYDDMWWDEVTAQDMRQSNDTTYSSNLLLVNQLNTGTNAVIDLSSLNAGGDNPRVNNMQYPGDSFIGGISDANGTLARQFYAREATLGEGTAFRLGLYSVYLNAVGTNPNDYIRGIGTDNRFNDTVFIEKASQAPGAAGKTNLYIQLGWVPGLDIAGTSQAGSGQMHQPNQYPIVLGILEGAENFAVSGQAGFADGLFSKYYITPVIKEAPNAGSYYLVSGTFDPSTGTYLDAVYGGTAWYLDSYSYYYAGVSESGMAAADNAVPVGNLWRSDYLGLFRRAGALHRRGFTERRVAMLGGGGPAAATNTQAGETNGQGNTGDTSRVLGIAAYPVKVEDQKENIWAETWRGRFTSASSYGRSVRQSYSALQVGYDKQLDKDFYNGKAYAGLYVSKQTADTDTATGGGKQEADGIGVYATWAGNKGHYLDFGVQAARLKNDFHFTDSSGRVTADYDTWAYGLGAQYGYRQDLAGGWFLEPYAALFYGRMDGLSYVMSNHLRINQDGAGALTGKLGLAAGKALGDSGNVYVRAAVLRDFKGRPAMTMQYGTASQPLDTPGSKDTWYELGLGGNFRISPAGSFNLDFSRTRGSNIGNEWRLNGLFEWSWGGAADSGNGAAPSAAPAQGAAVGAGHTGLPVEGRQSGETAAGGDSGGSRAVEPTPPAPAAGQNRGNANTAAAQPAPAGQAGEYSFAPVTVEAPRPAWEKDLSPGQVSVIYPQEYKGEQKTLPDLLERVPGLFVQRVSGVGHYTVARLRASTAAQVSVYVDGVLMNLNGDAAVNLSTIPVENVERIEVYRGYIPARFSGSPLGGVINIVTKKPDKPGWYVKEGFRSYGGYQGSYEYTAPLGGGTLMAAYNRDIWQGDFPFKAARSTLGGGPPVITLDKLGNDYQNSDALVKWQDDHWMVKASWKKTFEHLPFNFGYNIWSDVVFDTYRQNRSKQLAVEQTEFQVGRRDTVGNLDWGWRVNYLDSKKDYAWPYYLEHAIPPYMNPAPGDLWSSYHSRKWGANLNAVMKMGGSHLVEFTADLSHETMNGNGSNWDIWNNTSYAVSQGRIYLSQYGIRELHLALQDTITLNRAGDFKLTPVLHADKVDMETMSASDKRWQYSGGVSLRKDFGERWTVKSTWGTYNRHPNFYEIFGDGAAIRPNTGLMNAWDLAGKGTWESGSQFDFGVDWKGKMAGADTGITLAWFQRDSKNQLVLSVPPMQGATASYLALDGTKAHGVELSANMNWRRVNLNLSGTWAKTEYTGKNSSIERGASLPWIPEWVVSARLDYTLPGDRLNLFTEYYYTGEQYTDYSSSQYTQRRLSALGTVNLGLKYKLSKEAKLTLGVNDVFNKGYEQILRDWSSSTSSGRDLYPFYSLPGRMYYVTMEYRL